MKTHAVEIPTFAKITPRELQPVEEGRPSQVVCKILSPSPEWNKYLVLDGHNQLTVLKDRFEVVNFQLDRVYQPSESQSEIY